MNHSFSCRNKGHVFLFFFVRKLTSTKLTPLPTFLLTYSAYLCQTFTCFSLTMFAYIDTLVIDVLVGQLIAERNNLTSEVESTDSSSSWYVNENPTSNFRGNW